MALSFPGSPNVNQIYVDTTSGNVYQWNGYVWINYSTQNPKNILELDDISGSFDGSETTFALTSGGGPITPVADAQIIINLGGVAQNAGTDFTVSGSNITFTTPPDAVLTFYGFVFGGKLPLSSVDDNSVTPYNLSAGAPVWDSAGNITITGIATIGSSSVVINGSTNRITVGSGATLSSDGITAGVITATTFYGDGSNLENVVAGFPTTASTNTTGIITAASFHGDGSGITNVGGVLEPLVYSPGIGETNIGVGTDIILTFQKPISANVGIVTIQTEELSYTQAITFAGSGLYGVAGNDREGAVSGNNATVTVNVGDTVIFSNSVSGSHPLYIRVSNGGASVSEGTLTGEGTATTTWDTFGVTPGTYYYQCSVHSAMIGEIVVQNNIADQFDVSTVGSSSSISISNAQLTLNPANDLGIGGTNYYVLFPANAFQDSMRTSNSVGISSYYFETAASSGSGALGPGLLFVAGNDVGGNLGQNSTVDYSSPVQIPGNEWTHTGQADTSASNASIKSDGTFWMWGYNTYGNLGQNNRVEYSSPIQIPGTQWKGSNRPGRPSAVGLSHNHVASLKSDGTLWVWGHNNYGQLGQNSTSVDYSSPVQVPGTQWQQVLADRHNIFATKTDGTLWCWGQNSWGACGQNDTAGRSSPKQVPGTQWDRLSSSNYCPFITKTDGTLWAWGYNGSGQLCTNDNKNRSSPYQIPGTQWVANPHGYYGFVATKTDGTLWAAGNNGGGALGQGDFVTYSSPRQIPGTQWEWTNGGYGHQGARKTDGTFWVWGYNTYGQLGLNDRTNRNSPVQLPGTYLDFGGTEYHSTFLKES